MARISANGIEIEYDTFGERGARPLLLIMGLGVQMIGWDEEFCGALAGRGHYVIRFDNRDVGLSTKFEGVQVPQPLLALQAAARGEPVEAPYTLDDMAADAAGLLGALGVPAAHVVGASMGGMIAQLMAIHHAERVTTLTSIMSTTAEPGLSPPRPEAIMALLKPAPTERGAYVAHMVEAVRALSGPAFPFAAEDVRRRAERSYDRSFYPAGFLRQLVAVAAARSRKEALHAVRVPTLVIHGSADPLVPLAAGEATAAAVPGAELLVIEGMGHELPRGAWPQIIDAISKHTAKALPGREGSPA